MLKNLLLLFLGIILSLSVQAQYFSTGADPASIKWKQIDEEYFQLIYPEEFEAQAKRFAAMLDEVCNYGYYTLGTKPKKISVVFHAHSANSNGMVGVAPKRMEIYPTPHQDIYAQDWLEQLAVHEYRHVVQTGKLQQDMKSIWKILFGEQAIAAVSAMYLPFWFLEGDAVVTETALTETGRGRNPQFLMENKAQLLEKGMYSYDKITLGSYKDYVPNRYSFGWWMVGGVRDKYGANIWESVVHRVARKPLSFNPVNKALKQTTGFKKEQLYPQLWNEYNIEWQNQIDSLDISPYTQLTHQHVKSYTNYLNTSVLGDGRVVAVKESRNDIDRIVSIDDEGNEEVLFTPGNMLSSSFSARGSNLVWVEYRPNIRWTHALHSKLIIYNVETKQKKEIALEENIFSPVLNSSEKLCLVSSVDYEGNYSLAVIDVSTGKLSKRYPAYHNSYPISPVWNATDDMIYYIGVGAKGKSLLSINCENGSSNVLIEPVRYNLRNLKYYDNTLLYTSGQDGIDNIYSFDLGTHDISKLTTAKFGADYPVMKNNILYYNNYTADGYTLNRVSLDKLDVQKASSTATTRFELADNLSAQEEGKLDFVYSDTASYDTEKYGKFAHSVNIHSWAPIAINSEDYTAEAPGVSLQSQNKLGTSLTEIGYVYNNSEDRSKAYLNYNYIGWFPSIKSSINYQGRNVDFFYPTTSGVISKAQWEELEFALSVGVPLNFSTGKYSQSLRPTIGYNISKTFNSNLSEDYIIDGYHSLNYQFFVSNMLRSSELDLQARWGQSLQVNYIQGLGGLTDIGNQFSVLSNLYFPGIVKTHGLKLYNAYQYRSEQFAYTYSDYARFPRGYSSFDAKEYYSFAGDYVFPICYPDLSLGRLFYMQRLRASLFFDYANMKFEGLDASNIPYTYKEAINSVGMELYFDGYVLRLPTPISLGVRGSRLKDNSYSFEFLMSIDLYGI